MRFEIILSQGAEDAPALLSVERATCTHQQLRQAILSFRDFLHAGGLGANDRVALVLPNGPEMAVAFLGTCCFAAASPLNPALKKKELVDLLRELQAKAVILSPDSPDDAWQAASALNLAVIEITPRLDEPAGMFNATWHGEKKAGRPRPAGPEDVALLLHTSGTTSRPKTVPLTQANLAASVRNIVATLSLEPGDRCLNIMPLFHVHGLIGGLLSALASGGSCFCSPGFQAYQFFRWLDKFQPTWYTAVPTMHQAILSRARYNDASIERSKLRFVRSSSAPLPVKVWAELEQTFSAPVINAYGMTEGSHQITSNPLPPGRRKPGTVGLAGLTQISVLDPQGHVLPAGSKGEVAIRGEAVTSGYLDAPEANRQSFSDGWLRTGDEGFIDEEGYLTLTGRLKELINRGGEKISPFEVEDALLAHPCVAQAVAFSVPHDILGEEVGAAVVLCPEEPATEQQIAAHAAELLAPYKVPRRVWIVDQIPKGPTGKLQRIGMAGRLAEAVSRASETSAGAVACPDAPEQRLR